MRVVEPRSMTPRSRTGSRAAKFGWEMASAKITMRTSGREAKGGKRYLEDKKKRCNLFVLALRILLIKNALHQSS